MGDVAIVGVGQSKFSRGCRMRITELCFEAFKEAMEGLNLTLNSIDACIISSSIYDPQRSAEAVITDYLGLNPKPTFLVQNACAGSSTAVRIAWSFINSGIYKVVAVVGVEKMSGQTSEQVGEMMSRLYDVTWESPFGLNMPAGYAMYARAYMARYGATEGHLAKVRVKNSFYGSKNPRANYQKALALEDILSSDQIASPLKKYDCCANADGASCVVLANSDLANGITTKPIQIIGLGAASDGQMAGRTFTSLRCAKIAAEQAYEMAGVKPDDIDVAEVHDCFTIAEILAYEDLGFARPGEGIRLIEDEQTYHMGKIPVNTDGGLLSKGHPVGATGGSQIRTIVQQLRGEAGQVQVNNAKIGLVHNVGGIGHYCNVIIMRRGDGIR